MTSSFWRYTAFQVPGWVIASVGGWLLHRWLEVPVWVASGILVVWVIKDYALYPVLRSAYDLDHTRPIDRLVGEYGTASDRLSPSGYVRVRGELWRATSVNIIMKGDHVEVIGLDGSTLVVRPGGKSESD